MKLRTASQASPRRCSPRPQNAEGGGAVACAAAAPLIVLALAVAADHAHAGRFRTQVQLAAEAASLAAAAAMARQPDGAGDGARLAAAVFARNAPSGATGKPSVAATNRAATVTAPSPMTGSRRAISAPCSATAPSMSARRRRRTRSSPIRRPASRPDLLGSLRSGVDGQSGIARMRAGQSAPMRATPMTGHIDPTRETFAAFRADDRPGPIHMLNLVRLRARAAYPDGREATGAEAYEAYGPRACRFFPVSAGRSSGAAGSSSC